MPHKRNPVLTENLTGIARLIRGNVLPSLENVALWYLKGHFTFFCRKNYLS